MSLEPSETEEILRRFVIDELIGQAGDLELGTADDLLTSGLLDSLGVMRLVRFLEERFGVEVPAADVTIEHFLSLETILAYLESRRESQRVGQA